MKILFIGDVFAAPGREIVEKYLKEIRSEHNINIVILNGENSAHGKGITEKIYKKFLTMGVNVVTMGNHTWDNHNIFDFISEANNLIIPANYANSVKEGLRYKILNYNSKKVAVISLIGSIYLPGPNKCPFETADQLLEEIEADIIFVDFHAEVTSEKIALGYYLDGRVSAVIGTHTHVPTLDARILPKGTAYQTDVGMNGVLNGVIGVSKEGVINKFITGLPNRFTVFESGPRQFNSTVIEINDITNKVENIYTINIKK